jgi:hypothetical protein
VGPLIILALDSTESVGSALSEAARNELSGLDHDLSSSIGHVFARPALLAEALTHPSAVNAAARQEPAPCDPAPLRAA